MFRKLATISSFLAVLAACDRSHSINLELVADVQFRAKGGVTRDLNTDDPEYQQLVAYLETNRDGWNRYDGMIPDVDVVFSADQFVLYIGDEAVFLLQRGEKVLVRDLASPQ